MPGLSFLSKKSWHTSNIKNVEKVWIAEQKAEQEKKKLAELQKQLQEERQLQELRQLQAQQGQQSKYIDNSLDWMYEGPASGAVQQQQSEEYLLGKIYKPQENKTFDLNVPVEISSNKSEKWMEKVSNKNDIFSRMHEDPMVMIKKAEKQKRDTVIQNPIKMEKIRQKISQDLEEYRSEKERKKKAKKEKKRMKKEEKKAKKEKKKQHEELEKDDHSSSSSSSSSDESDVDNDRKRTESSPSRKESTEANSSRRRDDSRDRRNDERTSSPPRRNRDRDSRDRSDRFRRDSRSRSPDRIRNNNRRDRDSRSPPRRKRDRSHDSDESRNHRNNRSRGDSRGRSKHESSSSKRDNYENDSRRTEESTRERDRDYKDKKYGLVTNNNQADARKDYLGPRPDLLKKKEDLKQKELQEKLNRKREDVQSLTAEERERRLQEMLRDAEVVDNSRISKLSTGTTEGSDDKDHTGKAQFLSSMRTEVYQTATASGLKDRLDQNRYYRQGAADLESSSHFLRKE